MLAIIEAPSYLGTREQSLRPAKLRPQDDTRSSNVGN